MVGAQQAELGMVPPNQRLGADDSLLAQVELRLVAELAVLLEKKGYASPQACVGRLKEL